MTQQSFDSELSRYKEQMVVDERVVLQVIKDSPEITRMKMYPSLARTIANAFGIIKEEEE